MKILIVYKASGLSDNPFVRMLAEGIRRCGEQVVCSVDEFWRNAAAYDIVHLQWPEEAFGWRYPSDGELHAFGRQLEMLRERHIPVVYTCHNAMPHRGDGNLTEAYRLAETLSDAVVHLGGRSRDDFRAAYPASGQLLEMIPHHIYEGAYDYAMPRSEARRRLGIPDGRFVILSFGAFRHAEERRLAWGAFRRLDRKGKFLLAPRLFPYTLRGGHQRGIKRLACTAFYLWAHLTERLFSSRITSPEPLVPDEELPCYFAAADVVLIQRAGILNSGNVPMAFTFGRVATGPDQGNIGELLRAAGNPVFDPADPASVDRALAQAALLAAEGQGERNRIYAGEYLSLGRIAAMYCSLYEKLHDGKQR